MLFVSEIVPIEYGKRLVYVSDTESFFVGTIEYGDSVTEIYIRRWAPTIMETADVYKKYKRKGEI